MFFCFLSSFFGGVSLCSGKSLCMLLVTRGKKERKCRMCIFPARLFLLFLFFFLPRRSLFVCYLIIIFIIRISWRAVYSQFQLFLSSKSFRFASFYINFGSLLSCNLPFRPCCVLSYLRLLCSPCCNLLPVSLFFSLNLTHHLRS